MKRIMIGFIAAVSIVFSGCGDKQEKKEPSDTAGQEISSETEGADVAAGENLQEELDENVGADENEVDGNLKKLNTVPNNRWYFSGWVRTAQAVHRLTLG